MGDQSLEDLLEESKRTIFYTRFNKFNRKLWSWIALLISIQFIGVITLGKLDIDTMLSGFIILLFLLPISIGFLSIFIGMIPFVEWKYEDRVYRIFLIFLLIAENLISLIILIGFIYSLSAS